MRRSIRHAAPQLRSFDPSLAHWGSVDPRSLLKAPSTRSARSTAVTNRTGVSATASMLAAAALLALAASAVALPAKTGGCASSGSDPSFTTSCDKLAASVVCPKGLTGAVRREPVTRAELAGQRDRFARPRHGQHRRCASTLRAAHLTLVQESWGQGPYTQLLPKAANIGASCVAMIVADLADACWVNLPNRYSAWHELQR